MKGIIYKYTFADGKVYIGQTRRHPEKRRQEHFDPTTGPTNPAFWDAYERMGEPNYEVLEEFDIEDVDELVYILNYVESVYIRKYHADNPQFGYNKKSFGTVSTNTHIILQNKFDKLVKELSQPELTLYNSAREKIYNTFEPLTEEEIFLIKEKYCNENLFQTYVDDYFEGHSMNDEYENELFYDDGLPYVEKIIIEKAKEKATKIIEENYKQFIQEENDKHVIVQLDKTGNIVREFSSFNEICEAFDVPRADNVKNVLKGKQKSAYGFLWKYKRDIVK